MNRILPAILLSISLGWAYGALHPCRTCSSLSLTFLLSAAIFLEDCMLAPFDRNEITPRFHLWNWVGFWLQYYCCCLVAQSFLTLCDPMDCSPPGYSVHGISQERTLERVAISLLGDLPDPGIEALSPALAGGFFPWATLLAFKCIGPCLWICLSSLAWYMGP